MRPPQTTGDWIFFLGLSSLVFAMGVLFFVFPPQPLPEQRHRYTEHRGRLDEVVARETGRRLSVVRFRMVQDPVVYENRFPRIDEMSRSWQPGHTRLVFHTVAPPEEPGTPERPRAAYGLAIDGTGTRTLEADIQHRNAAVSPWAGALALAIGSFGFLVAGLTVWRRRLPRR